MIETILLVLFFTTASIYLLFLLFILKGLTAVQKTPSVLSDATPFISVVIPCRNESQNIIANIQSVLGQTYPADRFEVIYVDDASTDDTADIIIQSLPFSRGKLIRLFAETGKGSGKKHALAAGIADASGEIIITSDADCLYNQLWLKTMAEHFSEDVGFISGPVVFKKYSSFFGLMQAMEFAGLVLAGAGLIGLKKPAICNGANVAYRKAMFDKIDGFSDKHGLSSGDDELIMKKVNELGTHRVLFLLKREAVVTTDPVATVSEFMQQRSRWGSKGLYYEKPFVLLTLVPVFLFFVLLIVFPWVAFFINQNLLTCFLIVCTLKAFLELLILHRGRPILQFPFRLDAFIICQIVHAPYIVAASLIGSMGTFRWKERVHAK